MRYKGTLIVVKDCNRLDKFRLYVGNMQTKNTFRS